MLTALFFATLVGLALGAFGGGGSLLSVVILSFVLGMPPKSAILASLLVTSVTSAAALIAQRGRAAVSVRTGLAFGGVGMIGALAGGRLGALIPAAALLTAFGVVMLLTSIAMLRGQLTSDEPSPRRSDERRPERPLRLLTLALSIGLVTGMLGAGGGFLIVPALVLHCQMPMKRAVGTSLLAIALQSGAGFVGHLGHPSLDWALVGPFTLVATLGSALGGTLARRAPQAFLRRGFAVFVLLLAAVVVARELPALVKQVSSAAGVRL